jgi:hypothetical protein
VHLIFPLLASGVACARGLSHRLADTLAVPHSGNRRGRRFGTFARPFFSACTTAARTASDLTDNLPVCTKVTSPRPSKKHRFWLLNRSFLNSLHAFAGSPLLWKPCGNCFLQKSGETNLAIKKFTLRVGFVPIMLNIKGLMGQRTTPRVA